MDFKPREPFTPLEGFLLPNCAIEILPQVGCEGFALLAFITYWRKRTGREPRDAAIVEHSGLTREQIALAKAKVAPIREAFMRELTMPTSPPPR